MHNYSFMSLTQKIALNLCFILLSSYNLSAQVKVTNTAEGVGEHLDKQRRSPTVSVSTISESGNVKILVDAYVADPDYEEHPIQFDFYINRHFFTSQIRSKELPGPIGVDISSKVATPPFNYTVVAKVLHPNRVFTTVINGAAFSSNLSTTYDCTLTTNANSEEDSIEYIANDVIAEQTSNENFKISFETNSTPDGHDVVLEGTLSSSGDNISGTLTITEDDGVAKSVNVTGTGEIAEDKLTSFEINSTDNSIVLSCS